MYTSGKSDSKVRSDLKVTYTPKQKGGISISLQSKVQSLYGASIKELAEKTLADLQIANCILELEDAGALPFVIAARIEAAVKSAHPELKLESLPEFKPHAKYRSFPDRFRRSRLYVPGNQPKMMLNVGIHRPDGVILDLEDSVAPAEKASARLIVRNALRSLDFFNAERMVRINQGDLGLEDLEALVPHNVHLILIPKVEDAETIKKVDQRIAELAKKAGRKDPVYLMPILESAAGIMNAYAIATASPNNVALAMGLEDYTADIGAERTFEGKESFFGRNMLINAAKAAGLQAIDTVFSDVSNMEALRESVLEAKNLGFDGKGCIHPRQIAVVHEALTPTADEILKAQKIVVAFDEAEKNNMGVVALGSKMIDPPVVKRALRTVKLAIDSHILDANWKESWEEGA